MSNELAHYGVKGMKWGVRKKEEPAKRRNTPDSEKGAHRVKTEAHYLAKGKTQAEAERLADRRIKTEKVLLAVGAVTVTAAAAYVGSQMVQKRFSGVDLAEGSILKNVNALGDKQDYDRRLYTTINDSDSKKYRGMLAMSLRVQGTKAGVSTTIYESSLKATERIKAPSHRQAEKLYKEFSKGSAKLKYTPYKEFNVSLVNAGDDQKRFYDFMKSKGFNAVLDSNDQFISGYNTKKPLIIFNAKSSTVEAGRRIVSEEETIGLYKTQIAAFATRAMAPYIAIGAAVVGGAKASATMEIHESVQEHFKKHPEDKRSYAEVYNDFQKEKELRKYKA